MKTDSDPLLIAPVLDAVAVAKLIEVAGIRVLDVRTPGEFESAHIRGAYNVPLDTLGEHSAEIHAHVSDPVVLVCQSGQRARKAELALKEAGMSNLHVLDGGMAGWLSSGNAVVRGRRRMSLERQVRIVAGGIAAAGGILAVSVNATFGLVSAFIGSGLVFAGVTDTCAMAMLLSQLPYNKVDGCDVGAMVRALSQGEAPAGRMRVSRNAPSASCST